VYRTTVSYTLLIEINLHVQLLHSINKINSERDFVYMNLGALQNGQMRKGDAVIRMTHTDL
jgi:hypothetical protein